MKSIGKFFHLPFRNRPRLLLVIERLLMAAGILAILIYGGARLYTWGYQAYTAYSFEEQLRGRSPSIRGFISHTFDRSHRPGIAERKPTAPPRAGGKRGEKESQPDTAPPRVDGERLLRDMVHAPEIVPEDKGWSSSRLRAYRKAAPPAPGSVMGRLEIPSLDLSVMLLHGTDDWTLNRAVGHIEGTSLPGEKGNLGIAGHRDGFFRCLKDIQKDTNITLTTLKGRFQYRVRDINIARPSDVKYLAPTPSPTLTLVTCYPFHYVGDAPKRYIVTAELVKLETADDLAAEYSRRNQSQP